MIEIFLKGSNPDTSNGEWWIEFGVDYPKNRPYVPVRCSDEFYHHLNVEVHNWIVDQKIDYSLKVIFKGVNKEYFIIFENANAAMLFKLRWV